MMMLGVHRTYCLITGASRGLGRSIAVLISDQLKEGSLIHLLARTESGLVETKEQILQCNKGMQVGITVMDNSIAKEGVYTQAILSCLSSSGCSIGDFDHVILIHNAGSATFKPVSSLINESDMSSQFALNIYGPISLNTQFFNMFQATKVKSVVQISSNASRTPYPSYGVYSGVKAARNIMFRVFAAENASVKVLNYAPGIVDTDMLRGLLTAMNIEDVDSTVDKGLHAGTVVTATQSAAKLIDILNENKFPTGDYQDYYGDVNFYDKVQESADK